MGAGRMAHAAGGLAWRVDEQRGTRRMLPPCHFGEPASDMRMRRLERACLVKGGNGVGKLPRRQTRVPVRKGLVR